jgi:hypothetical protein
MLGKEGDGFVGYDMLGDVFGRWVGEQAYNHLIPFSG